MKKCLQVLYSLGRGGTETTVKNFLSALYNDSDLEFDVLVHKRVDIGYEEDIRNLGINIYQIDHYNTVGFIRYFKKLYLFFKNNKYDVVHIHMDAACGIISLIAKQAKINRIICHSHSAGLNSLGGRLGVFINRIIYSIVKPICLACGEKAGKAMYGKRHFLILNNGIDTDPYIKNDFTQNHLKQELSLPFNAKIVLHVGRFDGPKNQSFIIDLADDVLDNCHDAYIVFAGTGIDFERVRNKAKKCKYSDRIIFLGVVNNVYQLMCDSNLFVLPSIYEGFPVTLVEAQCAGLPCIVSTGVTNESDLSVNSFCFLNLEKTIWVQKILEYINIKKTDVESNVKILDQKGFTSTSNSKYLKQIYLSDKKL